MTDTTISFVANRQGSDAELDAYVRAHPQGQAYQLSAWRNAVEQAYGFPGRTVMARRGPGQAIAGLLPLCSVGLPLARPRWISLPFCDLGGPLADAPEVEALLVAQARAMACQAAGDKLELRCSESGFSDDETELGSKKVRMLLDLPGSAGELMAGYPPKLRSQIRKAEKNGLTVELGNGPGAVDEFYRVYSSNMRRLGSPPHSRAWFHAIGQCYGQHEGIVIAIVRHQGQAIGAGLVLLCGKRAVIPWASTLAEFNPLAPNMLLYWAIQAHLCERGIEQFDFGRSTFGEGTYKFKRQWGARPLALRWQLWTKQGLEPERQHGGGAGRIRPLLELAWKKMPLAMANGLGPRLRRYITL